MEVKDMEVMVTKVTMVLVVALIIPFANTQAILVTDVIFYKVF